MLTVLLSLGFVAGCATKSDVRELEEQLLDAMARQERMIEALQRLTLATQDSVQASAESLFELRGDTNLQLLAIQDQLITLQELAGQSQRTIAGLRDQLEQQRRQAVMPVMTGDSTAVDPAEAGDAARQTFNAGVTNFNRGSMGTARRAFEQFLQAYPSHALAPDAQYYLADILVQESRLAEAIDAFNRIPELYPSAERVPWAVYRVGLLQADMGDTGDAIASFERVVNTFPESDVADLAQEKLRELR
jgi:tol-pal system protein YbgF